MREPYQRVHPVRDEEARKLWRLTKPNRCQCCHRKPDWRGAHVHHIIRFRRSDEPTNLLLLCAECHDRCHDGACENGKLTIGMMMTVKFLEDFEEFDQRRLAELYGSQFELEDLPNWLLALRKKR